MGWQVYGLFSTYPAVQGVQHRVTGPVGHAARTVGLTATPVVQALTTESSLVDLTSLQTAEGHAEVLQLKKMDRVYDTYS